jgi:ABC-2 type transport system ATP-binding protein
MRDTQKQTRALGCISPPAVVARELAACGVDVATHPALAKQLSGIFQMNTLDRQLTVWENLYHG